MKVSYPRIFIVDDDEDDRDLLFTAFSNHGVANDVQLVATSADLFSALDQLQEEDFPKLIILDHQTPGLSGSDTLSLLKSSQKYRHIPVAIYSSAITSTMKEELKKKQAFLTLQKALTLKEYGEHIALFDSIAR